MGVPDYYKTIKAKEIVISLWFFSVTFLDTDFTFHPIGCERAVSVIIRLDASVVRVCDFFPFQLK